MRQQPDELQKEPNCKFGKPWRIVTFYAMFQKPEVLIGNAEHPSRMDDGDQYNYSGKFGKPWRIGTSRYSMFQKPEVLCLQLFRLHVGAP